MESRRDRIGIAAAPLLIPLVAIAMVGDTAILRVVLWQGSLPALLTAMVIGLLPLTLGCAVFALLRGPAGPPRFRVAVRGAVVVACLVTPFTPVNVAALQWVLLAFLFLAFSSIRRKRRRLVTASLVILPFLGATILYSSEGYRSVDIASRIPCRNLPKRSESTLVVMIFGDKPGGTPFCGPLTVCLDHSGPTRQRERRVQEDCMRRSSQAAGG